MRLSTRFAAALLGATLLSAPVLAQGTGTAPAEATDGVAATVNGKNIMESDIAAMYETLPQQYRQMPMNFLRPQLLERAISTELLMQAGETSGLADSEEVKTRLESIKRQVVAEAYVGRYLDEMITDEVLQEEYERHIAGKSFGTVVASHILVKTEDEAKAVIEELKGGADFAELAKAKSVGPSGPNGGQLPEFNFGDMVPAFSQAAFSMRPGEFSTAPVQTQFGYHVILVQEAKDGTPPGLNELRAELEGELSNRLIERLYEKLRSDGQVVIAGEAAAPAIVPVD